MLVEHVDCLQRGAIATGIIPRGNRDRGAIGTGIIPGRFSA